ncbi:hypothetical protein EMCRGX_G012690 [Ephydatia muelleri]
MEKAERAVEWKMGQAARCQDNGEGDFPNEGHVFKDSDNCFTVWCTGRTGCDWMMAQLREKEHKALKKMGPKMKQIKIKGYIVTTSGSVTLDYADRLAFCAGGWILAWSDLPGQAESPDWQADLAGRAGLRQPWY